MKILIIDNNIDQPWQLCADFRRYLVEGEINVRRAPQSDLPKDIAAFSHIILSGSKTSIVDSEPWITELTGFIRRAVDAGIPMLGVCYGHQIIAKSFGGDSVVGNSKTPEFGWVKMRQTAKSPIFEGLSNEFHSFQSHYDEVHSLPRGFIKTAESDRCGIQAYRVESKPVFGIQFHPEKNAEEGQRSIDSKKKTVSKDCIFNDGKAESVFKEHVAHTIFRNFLGQRK